MTKSVRHSIALGATCAAATLSVPAVFDLTVTIFRREGAGWLIEPWYYTGFLWKICLIAFLCEITRQVAVRKVRWFRFALLALLFGAAWVNWRYWFIPTYAMLAIGVGLLCLYAEALVGDLRKIAQNSREPIQRATDNDGAAPRHV